MLLYGCVFSAYIFWRELNPYYLADSRVLWKIQAIKVHCKQNMFLFEFWNGRGMNNMFNFQQVDFWIIKAKTIEISIYLQVVLSLFVCLFLCLFVFKSIQLHYFSHLLDWGFLVLCRLETGQQCIAYLTTFPSITVRFKQTEKSQTNLVWFAGKREWMIKFDYLIFLLAFL